MNSTLRVTLVGPMPPPAGGMANQTRQLKRLLELEGVGVRLVQTNMPYRPRWVARLRGVRALARLLPYARAVYRGVEEADVVHVMANSGLAWDLFAAPAIGIAKLKGRPVIVNYRGGLAATFLSRSAGRVRRLLRGTRLVVPTRYLYEIFARYGIDARVIPNVVDVELFRPSSCQGSTLDRDRPRILIARNLEPIYGIDLGLRAVAILHREIPNLSVRIAGAGPERVRLEALAAELGLTGAVIFTGRLEPHEMAEQYRHSDIVLNPVRADNAPNSVLEALASGVPVVSTRVGGVPFLVQHERSAILTDPDSPAALAEGMRTILSDAELRRRLVDEGLALAAACSWPRVRNLWLETYRAALS